MTGASKAGREARAEAIVETRAAAPHPATPHKTVYDDIRALLVERGWAQGCRVGGRRALCLREAVDLVVGVDEPDEEHAQGARLARSARIRRHLRELAGTSHLAAWNDEQGRTLDEVLELLAAAALAYPDD